MALNIPWTVLGDTGSGPVFMAGFILGSVACLICRVAIDYARHLHKRTSQEDKTQNMDTAEKGGLKVQRITSNDEDLFNLEKRAFFSQSWLFVCHRTRFAKAGDYHTFSIAGRPFFVVLGTDLELRAFHNVCRHRAYTVVRRAQGSSLRFSCKYHGWQYDAQGKLVKAPQFEDTVGFDMQRNGLYEIALHVDTESFIFVNFAPISATLPGQISSPRSWSGLAHGECFEIKLSLNWRSLVQHLEASNGKAETTALGFVWRLLTYRGAMKGRPLGPLAMLQYIEHDCWCTLSLLPESSTSTTIRFDTFLTGVARKRKVHDFKADAHKYWTKLEETNAEDVQFQRNLNRFDDINEMLLDHRQREQRAGKSIDPACKDRSQSGESDAVMLCHAVERSNGSPGGCPKQQGLSRQMDW